jgi:hypothetical protein
VEDVRVLRVDVEVGRSVAVVRVEDFLPGVATVGGHEDAAFLVRSVGMADGRDVYFLRVARVDDDARDVARVGEAEVFPGLAAVGGLVDAVAEGDRVADVGLAAADINDVGIARFQSQVTDGLDRLLVEDRRPGGPGIR